MFQFCLPYHRLQALWNCNLTHRPLHYIMDSIWRDQLKRCTRYLNVIANAAHTIDKLVDELNDIVYNSN